MRPVDNPGLPDTVCQIVHHNVLADGQVRNKGRVDFLIYNFYSKVFCDFGVCYLYRFPVDCDITRVVGVDAGENLHQGALARAIGSDDRLYLAPAEFAVYILECLHARKLDTDIFHDNLAHSLPFMEKSKSSVRDTAAVRGTCL